MPRTRLGPRTALRLAYACDAEIAVVPLAHPPLLADKGLVAALQAQARKAALGGVLDVRSEPGEGTVVVGTLPTGPGVHAAGDEGATAGEPGGGS